MRHLCIVVGAVCAAGGALEAQAVRSRSADYLFAASANDARALWVNPAGLAVMSGASIMAEFALEFPPDTNTRFAQWSAGFTSRGLSLGYQRDRFAEDPNTGTLRFGLAFPFRKGAVGASFSFYQGSAVDTAAHRSVDLGVRYRLLTPLDLGIVLRNIGRPTPRAERQPLVGVLAANLSVIPSHADLQVEVLAAERLAGSGYDMSYRGGVRLSTSGKIPLAVLGVLDVDSDFGLVTWAVGLTIGGRDSGTALASGPAGSGRTRLQRASLTGVATRLFSGQ
ncbi:MAG: hypothetical protein AMS20_00465 [Gemmatimonas sp. SG8_28]|nr:MAG: hypothetical protein AMS20_00465 [Gemmatimonas sp. SG8_28]